MTPGLQRSFPRIGLLLVSALVMADLAVVVARLDRRDDGDGLRASAGPSTTGVPAPVVVGGVELAQADLSAPPSEPRGVYAGGTVVLRGSVPDGATAAGYHRKASTVVDPGNVIMHMTLDPRVSGRTLRIDIDEELRFPTGSASFGPGYDALLDLGVALRLLPEATLTVTGHTDAVGDEGPNLALSVTRAEIVVDWLVERGVPPDRIVARGAGESEPVADNGTPEGRAANRRVEATVEGITPD